MYVPNLELSKGYFLQNMPQIPVSKNDDFKKHLEQHNIKTFETMVNPYDLKPTQKEFSSEKISKMNVDKVSPIIVSKDNFVLDGHHRWLKHVGENKLVPAIVVDATSSEAYHHAKEFWKPNLQESITSMSFADFVVKMNKNAILQD